VIRVAGAQIDVVGGCSLVLKAGGRVAHWAFRLDASERIRTTRQNGSLGNHDASETHWTIISMISGGIDARSAAGGSVCSAILIEVQSPSAEIGAGIKVQDLIGKHPKVICNRFEIHSSKD
jgi:hypothetical protein